MIVYWFKNVVQKDFLLRSIFRYLHFVDFFSFMDLGND